MLSDQDKIKWFDCAVKFQLEGQLFLVMKSKKAGKEAWAIENMTTGQVLNSNMEWEDELPLAKRNEAYLIRTRFDFDTALVMYEQYKMFAAES
jgi:hypothetical protein